MIKVIYISCTTFRQSLNGTLDKNHIICFLCIAEKVIDVNAVDLNKLRVKELKKILSTWGEDCRGCAEKYDFVSKIHEVKHRHIEL